MFLTCPFHLDSSLWFLCDSVILYCMNVLYLRNTLLFTLDRSHHTTVPTWNIGFLQRVFRFGWNLISLNLIFSPDLQIWRQESSFKIKNMKCLSYKMISVTSIDTFFPRCKKYLLLQKTFISDICCRLLRSAAPWYGQKA